MFFEAFPSTTGRVVTGPRTCSLRHFCPLQAELSRDGAHVLWVISVHHKQGCQGTGHMFFGSYPFITGSVVTGPVTCSLGHSRPPQGFRGTATCSLRNFRPPQAGFSRDQIHVLFGISQSTTGFRGMGMGNMFILRFSSTAVFFRGMGC